MECYLCNNKDYHKREGKVRDNPDIGILECDNCGLVFLDTNSVNEKFYEQNNMLSADFFKLTQRDNDTLQNQILFLEREWGIRAQSRLNFLKETIIGKELLDFGSGHGQFLIQAKPFAKSVTGIEIEEQVKPIYEQNNITLLRKLSEATGGGYDIITAFHVIEHLQDPVGILKELSTKLKENGKIIIEVPNANDALLTIYKNKAFQEFTYYSGHLFLYNPHNLKILGEKSGFKVNFVKCIQRYPLSSTLHWLSTNKPQGHKLWGNFIDNEILQNAYEQTLASLGATDTLIAQFSKTNHSN
ncbi:class I SAM-dependent methyltransferase [Campylobacter jejuni]